MPNQRGTTGTIVFHLALLIIILVFGYKTKLPLPEEEGILINFGTDDFGSGRVEPRRAEPQTTSPATAQPTARTAREAPMTQDFEEAPVVEQRSQVRHEEPSPEVTRPEANASQPRAQPVEEPRPTVNERALYRGRSDDSQSTSSEGITGDIGNQGSESGSVSSPNHAAGNSQGTDGISFSLDGRNSLSLPKPEYNYQESGRVVVEVIVDRSGRVISATPGVRGSTTLNEYLLSVSRRAALNSRFDQKADAPASQKGTITYHFVLQ